ncbi:helix-turn-helix domain-containing protein [Streptococcus porci]|uniref:helix-turn-helix domain-containing protein n=1 Tax=Streptococcus porci TaxID=502567 RepID=UPI00042A2073|nr:helix-turn-helix transcriptional regulator [Streptococcus porci]
MTIFAEQLKKFRQEKNISQEELAKQLFISRQAISKWENGDATPDLGNLVKLSEIFKISLDELVKGEQFVIVEEDDDNLHLLKGREYVMNPETGKYEKRDGLAIFIDLISEYWWLIFFVPLFVMWIKILIDLF